MAEPPIETGPDGVTPKPRRTGLDWLDLILALSAIAISLISLGVAIDNGLTERRLVAASSWPFLVYTPTDDIDASGPARMRLLRFTLTNAGVGPAHIKSARIWLHGHLIRTRRQLLALALGQTPTSFNQELALGLHDENPILGVLSAHDELNFLGLALPDTGSASLQSAQQAQAGLRFDVCYCSVLADCWRSDLTSTGDPKPVAHCTPRADDYTN